ncbi:MAG: hypothetical protein C0514_02170 [Candidatus Puniceispirillum sp.]|nr:hypothetical protein [Candidatus Puniceispirillum sp.]
MMLFLRSLLFNALFYPWTFLMSFRAQFGVIFGQAYVIRTAYTWGKGLHALLSWVVGVTYEIRGKEIWGGKPALIACKHESVLETSAIQLLAYNSAIVLKKELTWIPLFGHSVLMAGVIPINRAKGKGVLPQIVEGARGFFAQGRSLFLFPEGTRKDPHKPTVLRPGIATLYEELKVPVYPIALNTGLVWGRRKFLKRPGKVIYEFLPPILPGLTKQEFLERLTSQLEEARLRLHEEVKGQEPKPRLSNFGLFAFLGALALGLVYAGFWYTAARSIDAQLAVFQKSLAKDGITLTYTHTDTTGFPFSMHAHFEHVRLDHPNASVTSQGVVTIGTTLFKPHVWHLSTQGVSRLTQANSKCSLDAARVTSTLDVRNLADFSLALEGPAYFDAAGQKTFEAKDLALTHTRDGATQMQNLALDVTSPKGHLGFVDEAEKVSLAAMLTKPLPSLSQEALTRWQEEGGTFEISQFHLKAAPLDMTATATLTLDARLQLEGAASVYATGVNPFLDTLVSKDKVSFLAAQGYKLAFHLATVFSQKKGVETKDGVVAVSLSLQDGTLSLGQTPLFSLPLTIVERSLSS